MAMPRYRYAIGQAPVRFPSPAPSHQDDEDKKNAAIDAGRPSTVKRTNRWSTASMTGDVPASTVRRDDKTRARLQDDRRRTKSMYDGKDDKYLSPAPDSSRLSPHSSAASVKTSKSRESLRRGSQGAADERTPLKGRDEGDMAQRQPRPASASVSSTIRPSSLFWTDCEAEQRAAVGGTLSQMSKSKSSYGAMESTPQQTDGDPSDPYGYRFLAGPALLPTFHEQQQKQQKQKEVNSRTCGPGIEAIKRYRWVALSVVGLVLVVYGLWWCVSLI